MLYVHSTCCRAQWHVAVSDTGRTLCKLAAPPGGWTANTLIRQAADPPAGNICGWCAEERDS